MLVGWSCLVRTTFAPLATGPGEATLTLRADPGGSVSIDLAGKGVSIITTAGGPSRSPLHHPEA